MSTGSFSTDDVVVMRVLSEDEDFIRVEVVKNETRKLQLDPDGSDRFYTFVFVKMVDGAPTFRKPWDKDYGS